MNQVTSNGIWVVAELENDLVHPSTLELLGKAHEISQANADTVTAILLETDQTNHAKTLIGYGADQVLVVKNNLFSEFDPMLAKKAIAQLAKEHEPNIVLFAATLKGRALAPRLQGALQTGLTADCLDLSINQKGELVQVKPSYGDNLMCTILTPERRPQMATVRPNVFNSLAFDSSRQGAIIDVPMTLEKTYTFEVLEKTSGESQTNTITDADKIVAVGRGMKMQDNLVHTEKVAKLLNAKVGATRPLAENGWYTHDEQIGQSGVTIQPQLLLNFGIAGAIQYTVGMNNAKFVFSVNKDPKAAIFQESDVGYVGDAVTFSKALGKLLESK